MASRKTKKKIDPKQILTLKAQGLTHKQISGKLGCCESVISYWVSKNKQKTKAQAQEIPIAAEPQLMALVGSPEQIAKALSELGQ